MEVCPRQRYQSIRDHATICEVIDDETAGDIQAVLTTDDVIQYSTHKKQCKRYEDAIDAFRNWYRNSEKRSKLLIKLQ